MRPFSYVQAVDVRGALSLLASHPDAVVIAGGTNLLDLMKLQVATPPMLIDVTRLPLRAVERGAGGGLRIGALVANSDLAHHPLVRRDYALLADALLAGASPQLRNMATVGGNLLQRTRCTYFNDPSYACNKRQPGSGCSAIGGVTRGHAVLGTSAHCIATHPSDMAVALAALDATVHVVGPDGERRIAFADFHREPGDQPQRDTTLQRGELVLGIELPPPIAGQRSAYVKVRDRASYAFALASAAVLLAPSGTLRTVRIALGGVATKPWRARAAERMIAGALPNGTLFEHAAGVAVAGATPQADNAFKIELAQRVVRVALAQAAGLASED
jgi:xanthine dehydrogenase YagS FAD-binding subunit